MSVSPELVVDQMDWCLKADNIRGDGDWSHDFKN